MFFFHHTIFEKVIIQINLKTLNVFILFVAHLKIEDSLTIIQVWLFTALTHAKETFFYRNSFTLIYTLNELWLYKLESSLVIKYCWDMSTQCFSSLEREIYNCIQWVIFQLRMYTGKTYLIAFMNFYHFVNPLNISKFNLETNSRFVHLNRMNEAIFWCEWNIFNIN